MVEAGAKIVPESVMAEAIMFGHRSLAPIVDLQEQLREQVGKPKRMPYIEPGVDSILEFAKAFGGRQPELRRLRRRDHQPRRQAGRDRRDRRRQASAAGKIVDRWSTLVNPGVPIIGRQLHGITDEDVKDAPSPDEAARSSSSGPATRSLVGHNIGFDIGFLEAALGHGAAHRARPLPRHAGARARGIPGHRPEAGRPGPLLRAGGRAQPPRPARRGGHGPAADPPRLGPARAHQRSTSETVADAIRSLRSGGTAGGRRQGARLGAQGGAVLEEPVPACCTRRSCASWCSTRASAWTAATRTPSGPISVEVGLLPRAHGSALFTRGETQALTVATLGPSSDVQRIDTISPEESKRYLHHYNFPPYSTGENKPMRGPSRRDIGHGALAERALVPVLPPQEEFPYVIRVVSEVVTSNGSTSMASTCGSTLALMDAGVPIKAPVAGAAMGLVSGEDGKFAVLTDILGKEDAFGDMDFKVTGTSEGITALQMDIKVLGINEAIIRTGLAEGARRRGCSSSTR